MRKFRVIIGVAAALPGSSAIGQSSGGSGAYPDLRNSDMGAHDTATQPSSRDVLTRAIMNDNIDRAAKAKRDRLGPARPAKPADLTAGADVYDRDGLAIARIEAIDPDGVILSNGKAKVKVPADAFGRNRAGLLLDMPKAQFEQLVAKANAG